MLDELRVENLGILEDVTIEPGPGLVVVSGETGTGKTMLLGALRLLTGSRPPSGTIGPGGAEAIVEGRFIIDGVETVLARRVGSGRSKAYVDGRMVPARVIEEQTQQIVEIIGQHDRLELARPASLRKLVDARLGSLSVLETYHNAWDEVRRIEEDLEAVGGDRRMLERERDLLLYQYNDISSAGFRAGDDEVLRRDAARLRNAAELIERLSKTRVALDAGAGAIGATIEELRQISRIDPTVAPLVAEADELAVKTADLSTHVRRMSETLDPDPGALEDIELRIARLSDLRRKYGSTLDEVLRFGADVEGRLVALDGLLERSQTLGEELEVAASRLSEAGIALRTARNEAARTIEHEAGEHLNELGFTDALLELRVDPADAGPNGADTVAVLFASDRQLQPGPVEKVASGGELSRLVLALHLAADVGDIPTVAFDEIDAGVGGQTALALGRKLSKLAVGRQVLCVTHLPQVAAFAERHFVVTRTGNRARVSRAEGEDRLSELTRMLAGLPDSKQGRGHAKELIAAAQRHDG